MFFGFVSSLLIVLTKAAYSVYMENTEASPYTTDIHSARRIFD